MAGSTSKVGHFLVVPIAAWGHLRPFLHLSLNILLVHPGLHLTLLLPNSATPRVEKELASKSCAHVHRAEANQGGKALIDRLQIIQVASKEWMEAHPTYEVSLVAEEAMEYAKVLPGALIALSKGEGKFEGQTNKFTDFKPNFLIYDMFQSFVPQVARDVAKELGEPIMPLMLFTPSNAAAAFHLFGRAEKGGNIELMMQKVEEATANGMDELEAWSKYIFYTSGRLLSIPGTTPMYDYELFPQAAAVPLPPQFGQQTATMVKAVRDKGTVAIVLPTMPELEPETRDALAKELEMAVIHTGVQFPESTWKGVALERDANDLEEKKVLEWMDDMLKKKGERSVAYISFGSAFFPSGRPELAQWLVESLTESGVPFIFAYATDMLPVRDDLIEYVRSNPMAYAIKFAPQWQILEHPATRFFISHTGSNSTAEAMMAGVPMVSHPFAADQGEFTAMMEQLGVTIDLKQVKTFKNPEWKKLHDGTEVIGTEKAIKEEQKKVWAMMMGAKGDEMRANMKKLRERAAKSRESGQSKEGMEAFSKYY